jgi:hypothetical protein
MALQTPFFTGFQRRLFGAPPRSALEELLPKDPATRSLSQLQSACGEFIPAKLLALAASKLNSRERFLPPLVTFWAFLAQVLAGSSCRDAVRRLLAWRPAASDPEAGAPAVSTAAYCRARGRLPTATLENIHTHLAAQLERETPSAALWQGRHVRLIDGSTMSTPDTAENQARWPQSANQKPGCGFPTLKCVALFCLASGALLRRVYGHLRESEQSLARQLWGCLQKGEILLGDRGFCSYFDLSALQRLGVDAVLRLHASRKVDFRRGKKLGLSDRLMTWTKPERHGAWSPEEHAALPKTLTLRLVRYRVAPPGFRSKEIIVVTTLLDPVAYPPAALAELYRRRWEIELHWRECKTTLRMDQLRCQRPEMIEKELWLHAIAYNLVRALMQRAAVIHHRPLEEISFKGSLDTLHRFADAMHEVAGQPKKRAALFARCLEAIAADVLPRRPHRVEPRALKRRPKPYDWLNTRRAVARAKMTARKTAKKKNVPKPA